MAYDPKADDRWTFFVSGFDEKKNEIISVMAGNPITAEFVADLFRREGMTRVRWRNVADA